MKPAQIHDAIHKASHETSRIASAHLRAEAINSGWPSHIAHSLNVSYDKDGFTVHAHEDHHSDVLNHEYGTPDSQPNAVIRRSANRTAKSEQFFLDRLQHHLGDLL